MNLANQAFYSRDHIDVVYEDFLSPHRGQFCKESAEIYYILNARYAHVSMLYVLCMSGRFTFACMTKSGSRSFKNSYFYLTNNLESESIKKVIIESTLLNV